MPSPRPTRRQFATTLARSALAASLAPAAGRLSAAAPSAPAAPAPPPPPRTVARPPARPSRKT
ncbi:MAG: hypothetical protein NTV51_16390 [Verrucomicrobia bacterium]|nr:hypothetical protein [Verrucomicrobiota bacterium]